jgi:nitronate monooxygenase
LLAREGGAFPAYQERLLAATETDTALTRAFSGRPARIVRNRFVEEHLKEGAGSLARPYRVWLLAKPMGKRRAGAN